MARNANKDILTVPQAAEYCAVDRVTMWRWIKAGNIKASVTPGGHHRIIKGDLESFLADQGMYPLARRYFPKNKVLVVDDEKEFCDVISRMLSMHGFETAVAADGFVAGLQILQFKPDLVLLDLVMPVLNGYQTIERLKSDQRLQTIPVIALTASALVNGDELKKTYGFDAYLSKPFSRANLWRELMCFLDFSPLNSKNLNEKKQLLKRRSNSN